MVSMSKAKAEPRALPKRFYVAVDVQQEADGFSITLDGKIVRTPARNRLHVASQQLAQQIAAEWGAQIDVIDTDRMPLTRLTHIALDRVPLDRSALLADIAAYGETDLVCYRAPQQNDDFLHTGIASIRNDDAPILRAQQDAIFDPILQWANETYGLVFEVTDGIIPIAQTEATRTALGALFAAANDHELAALAMMVPILGSALLTLAVWKGHLLVEEALAAARLDEDFQAQRWGSDPHVAVNWAAKCRDVQASAFFLTCNGLK